MLPTFAILISAGIGQRKALTVQENEVRKAYHKLFSISLWLKRNWKQLRKIALAAIEAYSRP